MSDAQPTTRILIVDDSSYNRQTLAAILAEIPNVEVVGTASDGEQGLKEAARLMPDLITADIEMPRMDGFTFLRLLMSRQPTPVIVISSHSRKHEVFQALELGALDFIPKASHFVSDDTERLRRQVEEKVRVVRSLHRVFKKRGGDAADTRGRPFDAAASPPTATAVVPVRPATRLVCIGASTGGPPALQALFKTVSGSEGTAFVVAQHMPEKFTQAFANRLNRLAMLEIQEATDGQPVMAGHVYIAPGGAHLELRQAVDGWRTVVTEASEADTYVPSVDRLFESVAALGKGQPLAVVLTGMGVDGAKGVRALRKAGARIIAESEETAVVYGMPKEAVRTGCVDQELPFSEIIAAVQGY